MAVEPALVSAAISRRGRHNIGANAQALAIWALAGGLVLYLALNEGGYDLVVRSQAGTIVWWLVLLGAVFGVLPASRLTPVAWAAVLIFACFVVWTALASTWSLSSERSLQELSRVTAYFGALVLAVASYGDRRNAMRHAIAAVASVVVIAAVIALLSRLRPDAFPAAQRALSLLNGANGRLSWPLNYWNALAALMAIGLPLLLSIATSARTLVCQAAAAAAIPVTALVAYFTFSRGGAIEAGAALIVFVALVPERAPKLATILVCATGSAVLIAGAVHRYSIDHGLATSAATHQGGTLLVTVVLVCAGVAITQIGIGLAARHRRDPMGLRASRRVRSAILAAAVIAGVAAALALHAPTHISHLWTEFKGGTPSSAARSGIGRFSTVSGEGRYTYWKVAVDASGGHVLTGAGPGTFQLLWLPRAPFQSYVMNAHSLYVETYVEVGLIGLVLLLAFFATVLGAAVRRLVGVDPEARTQSAAIAATCVAFLVAGLFDWVWQMPVLPIAILLLAASVLVPVRRQRSTTSVRARRLTIRAGLALVSTAGLIAIGVPLATANAVRRSQAAVGAKDTNAALVDARSAIRLEPGAATPEVQTALVLELRGALSSAVAAARKATQNEPTNWQPWFVLSRLEAESGHAKAAVAAYRRARAANPRSSLFAK